MKRNLFVAVFIISIFFLISCKKGDDGAQGKPGTANVKYSEWFTATPWTKDTVFGVWGFYYIKNAADITQQLIDSGAVLTFGKMMGYNSLVWPTGQVGQLPINITYQQGGVTTDTWSASVIPGKLKIRFVNDRNTYNSISPTHQFRYIIIPGGVPAGRGQSLTYKDVCREYNIPE